MTPLDPETPDHRLKIEFGDGQFWVTLLCPESGCTPAWDAPDGGDECWLKGWADNGVIDEGLVGEVTLAVVTSWDGDGPVSKIVPDPQLDEWKARAEKAEAERDSARATLAEDLETCGIYGTALSKVPAIVAERDALREQLQEAREIVRGLSSLAEAGRPAAAMMADFTGTYVRAERFLSSSTPTEENQ